MKIAAVTDEFRRAAIAHDDALSVQIKKVESTLRKWHLTFKEKPEMMASVSKSELMAYSRSLSIMIFEMPSECNTMQIGMETQASLDSFRDCILRREEYLKKQDSLLPIRPETLRAWLEEKKELQAA